MHRLRTGWATATAVAGALALAAGALAAGSVHYEAGSKAHPPYVYVTVANGQVVSIRWKISESCGAHGHHNVRAENAVQAPIGSHGHFTRTLHYLGSTTTLSGTIGKTASVTVQDSGPTPQFGHCQGSHSFSGAGKTSSFH